MTACGVLKSFSIFVTSLAPTGLVVGDDIMEKAFTWTLCFDALRILQIQDYVKNKATVNDSWCVFILLCLF